MAKITVRFKNEKGELQDMMILQHQCNFGTEKTEREAALQRKFSARGYEGVEVTQDTDDEYTVQTTSTKKIVTYKFPAYILCGIALSAGIFYTLVASDALTDLNPFLEPSDKHLRPFLTAASDIIAKLMTPVTPLVIAGTAYLSYTYENSDARLLSL